jgi:hypothetical protein
MPSTQIPEGRHPVDKVLVQAKKQHEKLMFQFNELLRDKMLHENKTQGQLGMEGDIVLRLLKSASELDSLMPPEEPEGTFGLIALLIRIGFVTRDTNNRMEYNLKLLHAEINKLKTQIADISRAANK